MAYNPRYSNGHRARQLRARVLAEETHCALCGQPVDTTLPARHPAAPEVDHLVPVARGGALYARDNAALIHRACNAWKGARTLAEARAALAGGTTATPPPAPIQHSGIW